MLRKTTLSLCLFVILQLHDPSSLDSGDQLMETTYYVSSIKRNKMTMKHYGSLLRYIQVISFRLALYNEKGAMVFQKI